MTQDADGAPLGVLGDYLVDEDDSRGLFLMLEGRRVFVDIRPDARRPQREADALRLFANTAALDALLARFRRAHPRFADAYVESIGLHSNDAGRAEVFWSPEGYTLLRDLEFVDG